MTLGDIIRKILEPQPGRAWIVWDADGTCTAPHDRGAKA